MGGGQASQRNGLLRWARDNRDAVPNLGRLYSKMVSEDTDGHYVHAHYARKLHDCVRYTITDIEAATGEHDVDIQLDGRINIQVWHGMNNRYSQCFWRKPENATGRLEARNVRGQAGKSRGL